MLAKFVWRYASWSLALGGSFVCVCGAGLADFYVKFKDRCCQS